MYVYSREGLGEPVKKAETSGDKVGPWLTENLPTDLARVIGLKVVFRESFPDFVARSSGRLKGGLNRLVMRGC